MAALKESLSCRVTASGGVRDIEDIKNLLALDIYAVIAGKALYSGSLDLKGALELTGERKRCLQNG